MDRDSAKTRVFVIEDHPVMRSMLCEVVERHPRCTLRGTAASAEEALDVLATLEIDLALVDVSLPKMSGVDFVRCLRERSSSIRCLMVSGHIEPAYAVQSLEAGACGYVLKGRPRDLNRAITACETGEIFVSQPLEERLRRLEET